MTSLPCCKLGRALDAACCVKTGAACARPRIALARTAVHCLRSSLLLGQAGKGAKRDLLHAAFSAEALDEAGARREAPPFAVVASTDYDLSVGRRVYGLACLCALPPC